MFEILVSAKKLCIEEVGKSNYQLGSENTSLCTQIKILYMVFLLKFSQPFCMFTIQLNLSGVKETN